MNLKIKDYFNYASLMGCIYCAVCKCSIDHITETVSNLSTLVNGILTIFFTSGFPKSWYKTLACLERNVGNENIKKAVLLVPGVSDGWHRPVVMNSISVLLSDL